MAAQYSNETEVKETKWFNILQGVRTLFYVKHTVRKFRPSQIIKSRDWMNASWDMPLNHWCK